MSPDAQPPPMIWRRLPMERRRKLAVLIGRLARRHLEASPGTEEDSDDRPHPSPEREDPGRPP